MKLIAKKCMTCTSIVGKKKINLKANQDGFKIRLVEIECKNGHVNFLKVVENS